MNTSITSHPYIFIAFIAFISNIPCGYIRQQCQKFSLRWLFWIHASIPLLIYLRISFDVSSVFIPLTIFSAVIGQILGARMKRHRMTQHDVEKYEHISDLGLNENYSGIASEENTTVVLMNMGGPRTNDDVPDVQKRLFNDSRLIRFPLSKILQPIFAWLLVTLRAKKIKERYQLLGGGSPIFESTEAQTKALKEELDRRGHKLDVDFSFNYSEPLPDKTILKLKQENKKFIFPVSLYPHYSSATTGSNLYFLKEAASKIYPQLKFLDSPQYHLHDGYIDAFVDRVYEQLKPNESLDDFYLLFSAHGLPLYFLTEGDPYPFQISQTVGAVITKLNRTDKWSISWQSSVGPMQWFKPSTDAILEALAKRNVKKILVIPIAFVSDHIETTLEINVEYREIAEKLGFTDFRMSKALECHPKFIEALADTVENYLGSKRKEFVEPKKEEVVF